MSNHFPCARLKLRIVFSYSHVQTTMRSPKKKSEQTEHAKKHAKKNFKQNSIGGPIKPKNWSQKKSENIKRMKRKQNKVANEDVSSAKIQNVSNSNDSVKYMANSSNKNANAKQISSPAISLKTVDTGLFQYFNNLIDKNQKVRTLALKKLMKKLRSTTEIEKRNISLAYTLKRLVRGCGASSKESRTAFFTSLTEFLKKFPEDITEEQVYQIIKTELNTGAKITNKDDAYAVEGRILTCGALIRSGRIARADSKVIEEIFNILLQCSKYRFELSALAYTYVSEIINNISITKFEQILWPLLKSVVLVPWQEQTIHTLHCLLTIKSKFPEILTEKVLKTHLGKKQLLHVENFQHILKIFWGISKPKFISHPAFDSFGEHFGNSSTFLKFWIESVDPLLQNITQITELVTMKITLSILNRVDVGNNENINISLLLSPNFVQMLVAGLKSLKTKKDPLLKGYYSDFFNGLIKYSGKIQSDEEKVEIIRRLILHPGVFNIEKFTDHRIIHQIIGFLNEKGVKELFQLYKEILLNKKIKNCDNKTDIWLNFERQMAGYTLQHLLGHKSVQSAYDWRREQLEFFMICGIFHVTDSNFEICKKDSAGQFSKDFGDQMKKIFYSSLQTKLTDLNEEKKLLMCLAKICNEKIQQKNASKYFRITDFNDSIRTAWINFYSELIKNEKSTESSKTKKTKRQNLISQTENDENELQLVFHILLLNMGLQLFKEADMAIGAINDLLKCMKRIKSGENKLICKLTRKTADQLISETEPDWIEVIVDLFLHLLSLNVHSLRNIVTSLFSHLCGNLSLTAVHQILSMLNMKDNNPLCLENGESDDEEKIEEEEEREKAELNGNSPEHGDNEDEDDDDDDDEDDEDEDEEDFVEEEKEVDKLRNAISMALVKEGLDPTNDDDDMCSVDLNDMTEEEGQRLDKALAEAFKAYKKPSNETSMKKQSKNQRSNFITVMHFRIRCLDLIDVYLQNSPAFIICLEIMITLYNMIEHCVKDELKPLQSTIVKVLTKLTSLRQFGSVDEVKEKNLVDFIRLITEKKIFYPSFNVNNRLRNKCIIFLILNCKHLPTKTTKNHKIIAQLNEYVEDFIKSRNPIVNVSLFVEIFKLNWKGIWQLAVVMAEKGIQPSTRTFRRTQINGILMNFYKNSALFKDCKSTEEANLKIIENSISNHLNYLSAQQSAQPSEKEFQTILSLLLSAQQMYKKMKATTTNSILTSKETLIQIQEIRQKLILDNMNTYANFCKIHKLSIIKNSDVSVHLNGGCAKESSEDENVDSIIHEKKSKLTNGSELKKYSKEAQKERKRKKMQRMQASSKGLNDGPSFVQSTELVVDNDSSNE